jgi:RNA polymerase-binding transcription factor DksA
MNKRDIEQFKKRLLAEQANISQKSEENPGGWEATTGGIGVDAADENEVADKFEELEENNGIMNKLDEQLNKVKAALDRIDKGTYGICEICGKPIERDRLEADPSVRISIKHTH